MRRFLFANRSFTFCAAAGILAAISASVGAPPARAADSDTAGNDSQLTEIVVSAQRRTENLQSVPISAQVIGGAQLTEQNLNSLVDVSQTMPAVHVSNGAASGDMYIRGI
jgi:iron complex outermembrane receptor protein